MNSAFGLICLAAVASAEQYTISTIAGGTPPPTPAVAASASVGDPPRVAVDAGGNLYFGGLHSIFKVDRSGVLTRVAGNGRGAPDGFSYPNGIVVAKDGTLYFTDRVDNFIRRVEPAGTVTIVAGSHVRLGDLFNAPGGLALDAAGNLYVADTGDNFVTRVAPDGTQTVVAGNGTAGFSGDGGAAVSASLNGPQGIAFDAAGNLYIADTFNHRVRMVTPAGSISTFAGTGMPGFSGDGGPAATATMILPTDVATDSAGNVYIADLGNSRIRKVASGAISTVAGTSDGQQVRDGLPALAAEFTGPTGVAVDGSGNLYVAEGSIGSGSGLDGGDFKIWKVDAKGMVSTAAGNGVKSFSGDGGPAAAAQLNTPGGVVFDASGNLYFSDSLNHRVRKIALDGTITTVAGNALPGFSGDGGKAIDAQLKMPTGLAFDAAGNLYIADTGNNRVREVLANGTIGTLAGNGNAALYGDGGSSTLAALHAPTGVAVDANGVVYIADPGTHRIRRVVNAVIDTVVSGLNAPLDVKVDAAGNLYIADDTLLVVSGGVTSSIPVPGPHGLALDGAGNIYASTNDGRVVAVRGGAVTTIAGNTFAGYAGDGGPATAAQLNNPWGVAVDAKGNVYIADSANGAIRLLTVQPVATGAGVRP
jgi:sugar lactone lactonase YvrE